MSPQESTPSDIYPGLTYEDAPAAIEFLCRAFGFEKRLIIPGPDDTIMHSELTHGSGVVMIGSPRPAEGRVGPRALSGLHAAFSVCVEDADAHHERAKAAGAEIVLPPQDADYGSRGYTAKDTEGNMWHFATYRPGTWWGGETDETAGA